MADDGSTENNVWPMPKFYFAVDLGFHDSIAHFQEVSGLETETQSIECRHSNSKLFSTIKMPGIAKYGNITLKRGVFTKDNNFFKWYEAIKMNTIKRETVTIQLLDEKGKATMTWILTNAWPTKITGVDLNSDASEMVVDSIEIAHEKLTIKNGQ